MLPWRQQCSSCTRQHVSLTCWPLFLALLGLSLLNHAAAMESKQSRNGQVLLSISLSDHNEEESEQDGFVMPDVSSSYFDAVSTEADAAATKTHKYGESAAMQSGKAGNVLTAAQLSSKLMKSKNAVQAKPKSASYHEPDVSATILSAASVAPRSRSKKSQAIPEVSLQSISEYWDARRRSLKEADEMTSAETAADSAQLLLMGRKLAGEKVHGLGRPEKDVSLLDAQMTIAAGAQVVDQRDEALEGEEEAYLEWYDDDYTAQDEEGAVVMHPSRRLLDRTNGVSEMPDPEAAEYLTEHESKALKENLGSETVSIAKSHYNHTNTHVVAGAHPDHHTAEAATNRYSFQQIDEEPSGADSRPLKDMSMAEIEAQRHPSERGEAGPIDKQTGYAWFGEFPPPGFPDWELTTRSVLFTQKEVEAKKKEAETQLAASAKKDEEARKAAKRDEAVRKAAESNKNAGNASGGGDMLDRMKQARDLGNIVHSGAAREAVAAVAARDLNRKRVASKVWMSLQEISIVETHLDPNDTMLEWGSGYSTLWFSQFVREYYSIEHDEGWWKEMKDMINVTGNVHYQGVPVAKGHKGWGGGFEEGTYAQFEEYIKAVDNFKVNRFDKVLIDGRARAFCAEYVLKYLHADSLVFIHDYQDRFFYHGTVEKYYNKVVETFEGQSIIVIRPKKEALKKATKEAVSALGERKVG